jgi:hypothetical protein
MSSISANGGDTINISQISGQINYNINGGSNNVISSWPVIINNINTSASYLIVSFSDITLTNANEFFICGTEYIQFGNISLNPNGTRPIIIIDSVSGYGGLIRNSDVFSNGNSYINIFNLIVDGTNSILANAGGWIGQPYFANGANENYIVYCSSKGDISNGGGGITGKFSAQNGTGLQITGCTSTGNMTDGAGGIVGADSYSNYLGNIGDIGTIINCSSYGSIGINCGGICGENCGSDGTDNFEISGCYSTGSINGGGICGPNTGDAGSVIVQVSYSLGTIISGGGIFGDNSGLNGGLVSVKNSYVLGNSLAGSGSTVINTNCYIANGFWLDVSANSILSNVGFTWFSLLVNTPYILFPMGCSPYILNNIFYGFGYELNYNYTTSIEAGSSTIGTVQPGYVLFRILDGGDSSITINSATGAITAIEPGIYSLIIYGEFTDGRYSTTLFILDVIGSIIPDIPSVSEPPCCQTTNCIINPQTSDYDSSLITNKKQDKIIVREADQIFANVAAGRQVNPMPVFRTYYDYMNYLRGKAKY